MTLKKYLVLVWVILLASAAVAGDRERMQIKIAVDKDDAGEQTFMFDSDSAGLDLESMAVGETRMLTDASGNVATISRTVDGFEVDVAGETLTLGDFGSEAPFRDLVHEDEHHSDVHIDDNVRKIKMIRTGDDESVTIISGVAIDEATRRKFVTRC